jgi:hypothetical protein
MFKVQFEGDSTVVCSISTVVYFITVRQILLGYHIAKNEMSNTSSTSGKMTNAYKIVVENF